MAAEAVLERVRGRVEGVPHFAEVGELPAVAPPGVVDEASPFVEVG